MMAGDAPQPSKGPSLLDVAKTVLSAFLGVRRRSGHEQATARIRPAQLIVVAIVFALLFVLTIVAVVHLVVS